MIKYFIFDLDDTLISEKEYIKSGFEVISDKISKDYNLNKESIYRNLITIFEEDSKKVFNKLLERYDIKYNVDYIKNLVHIYRNHTPNIRLYDDAKLILNHLKKKNIKIGLITDGYKESQRKKIKALNLDKYFDYIIVTDELGKEYWKPSSVPYIKMKERFKCEFNEMVYIGDNIEKDFITAKKLGIYTVQIIREDGIYRNREIEEKYKSNVQIKSLKELVGDIQWMK